jgi:guanylate kinase
MDAHKIIIITAPSGAGKTSIVKYLLQKHPDQLAFSVSATTRTARPNETDGKDYYFLSPEQFRKHINNNDFMEWEMVYEGKYYGTLKSDIERIWKEGKTPVLDIDVKGAIHIQQQCNGNSFSVFIEPPGVETLLERLKNRGTETEGSLKARVDKANYELTFKNHFDVCILNDNLWKACEETEQLVFGFLKK